MFRDIFGNILMRNICKEKENPVVSKIYRLHSKKSDLVNIHYLVSYKFNGNQF